MTPFGPVLKSLRKMAGMTLAQLAKKLGTQKGYLSGIENEKVNAPSVKVVRKLYRIFVTRMYALNVRASEADFVELAWVSKAPKIIRERAFENIRRNPVGSSKMFSVGGRG